MQWLNFIFMNIIYHSPALMFADEGNIYKLNFYLNINEKTEKNKNHLQIFHIRICNEFNKNAIWNSGPGGAKKLKICTKAKLRII